MERCPGCGGWYRVLKIGVETKEQKNRSTFAAAETSTKEYIPTGIVGVDQVLGGGLVAGSAILFGGFRGAGKSTLLAQIADSMAHHRKVLFGSSEQSAEGVVDIAHRVGARSTRVDVLGNQRSIEQTLAIVKQERIFLFIADSLQKFISEKSSAALGSPAQGEAVAQAIAEDCRERKSCAFIVNQMARSGEFKGSTEVEHAVDSIMVLSYPLPNDEDAPEGKDIRILLMDKNRNGAENQKTYWKMSDAGILEQVEKKSKLIEFPSRGKYKKRGDED